MSGLGDSGLGDAMTATGLLYAGHEQKNAAEYNAKVLQAQAQAAEDKADFDIAREREATRRLLGTQLARYAAAGVEMRGTPLQVMEFTAQQGELDAQAIRYAARLQAAGYQSEAALSIREGQAAQTAAVIKSAASLLSLRDQKRKDKRKDP